MNLLDPICEVAPGKFNMTLKRPPGWTVVEVECDGAQWVNIKRGISVIASISTYDGKVWLHVSLNRDRAMLRYEDMAYVKRHWVGPHRKAIQVFAPESEHVNIRQHCLHLWACLDGDPLPDFTMGTGAI